MDLDLDDLTLHKFRALKECPQGQQPGDIFEATRAAGQVLVSVGAAEAVDEGPEADAKNKKGYKRRDLRAEE